MHLYKIYGKNSLYLNFFQTTNSFDHTKMTCYFLNIRHEKSQQRSIKYRFVDHIIDILLTSVIKYNEI